MKSPGTIRSAGGRYAALDGLRAIAAYSVILTHVGFNTGRTMAGDRLGPVLARMDIGVTIFFLLSGFLLYRPFVRYSIGGGARPHIGDFLWRRALRIFPALWIFVIVTLTWLTIHPVHPTDYVHYLLLVQVYDHHDYDPNLTHLWTLTVEVSFYALIPVFAWLTLGRATRPQTAATRQLVGFAVMALAAVSFNWIQAHTALVNTQSLLWLPTYMDWFATGMFLAWLSAMPDDLPVALRLRKTLAEWAQSHGTCWVISLLAFMLATLPVGVPYNLAPATWWQYTTQHYLFLIVAFFAMLPFVLGTGGPVSRALGSEVAHFLANISYSVYLWHVPLMIWIQREFGYDSFDGHFWTLLVLTTALTTVVSTISWQFVERPILIHFSRSWRGGPPAVAAQRSAAMQVS